MANTNLAVVVHGHASDRAQTKELLEAAGYRVRAAANFEEAKAMLASECPAILVTDLRLGPYNGLHLVLRSLKTNPQIGAVVTSHIADPVLEAEARRQHALFVLHPLSDADLLAAVSASLADARMRVPES
jgi:CheY-like chemotaxis protein